MKQVVFIREKEYSICRHMGVLRELCPSGSLNHFYGAFLLGLLWPVALLCLVLSVLGISQGPSMCACPSLTSQDGFQQRGLWVVDITCYGVVPPPFLTSREPLCACEVGEVSLTLKIRNT